MPATFATVVQSTSATAQVDQFSNSMTQNLHKSLIKSKFDRKSKITINTNKEESLENLSCVPEREFQTERELNGDTKLLLT